MAFSRFPTSLADVGFLLRRGLGLIRRGWASLRSRGWRATWERTRLQLSPAPRVPPIALFAPADAPFAPFSIPGAILADGSDTAPPPVASIVIPVYNAFAHTLACLRTIAAHPPATPFEVIVIDDGSSDDTADALPLIAGVRYRRRAQNGGFIAACNDGAALARGEYLVFLNNDTVPQPGWLEALVAAFAEDPAIGLVGAQLL